MVDRDRQTRWPGPFSTVSTPWGMTRARRPCRRGAQVDAALPRRLRAHPGPRRRVRHRRALHARQRAPPLRPRPAPDLSPPPRRSGSAARPLAASCGGVRNRRRRRPIAPVLVTFHVTREPQDLEGSPCGRPQARGHPSAGAARLGVQRGTAHHCIYSEPVLAHHDAGIADASCELAQVLEGVLDHVHDAPALALDGARSVISQGAISPGRSGPASSRAPCSWCHPRPSPPPRRCRSRCRRRDRASGRRRRRARRARS